MKNIRFDLSLFGESGEVCAAEQTVSATETEQNETAEKNSDTKNTNGSTAEEISGNSNGLNRVAKLLGIEGSDEDGIVRMINMRRARAALDERIRERRAKQTYAALISEAEKLSSKNKGFDLRRELSDRRFASMLRSGMSIEEAYKAMHVEELIEEARVNENKLAVEKAVEILRKTSMRPEENGTGRAPAQSQTSVQSLSGKGIREILRRVENGAKIKF